MRVSASPLLEHVHALILENARRGTEDAHFSPLSRRYHCAGAQYQDSVCAAAPPTASPASEPVPALTPTGVRREHQLRVVRVLAGAAAAVTASAPLHGTTQVRGRKHGLAVPVRPEARPIQAARQRSAVAGTASGGSFLTSLLIMLGLTGLALAIMFATEGKGAGVVRALAGAPSSLRSRRLSTSRISLRNPRGDGEGSGTIAYRE